MNPLTALLGAALLLPPAPGPLPPAHLPPAHLAPAHLAPAPPFSASPTSAPRYGEVARPTDGLRGTRPVPGPLVRGFDPPDAVWGSGHRGVDLAATPGERVVSALAGTVSFVGRIAGRGVVVVGHGALRTTYEPMLAGVAEGDTVAAGDALGVLDVTPGHCFPAGCLHWGLREGEAYLDPMSLLGPRRVRLLPLSAH